MLPPARSATGVNRQALARSGTAQNRSAEAHSLVADAADRPEPRAATGSQLRPENNPLQFIAPAAPASPHEQQLIIQSSDSNQILLETGTLHGRAQRRTLAPACCTEATPGRLVSPLAASLSELDSGNEFGSLYISLASHRV